VVDQPRGFEVADVPGHELVADVSELPDEGVAGPDPHLRDQRQDDAVGLAEALHEHPVEVGAPGLPDLRHPRLLLRGRLRRQQYP